ncbi:hypothetical protein GCM10023258_22580 [Terrabacter aeriphilus]|uniref:Uncharacterized protein n=1 Tax=Terrabacter aeriphilus TaxID=515662 RepID=A0ABP9JCD5_9MICO
MGSAEPLSDPMEALAAKHGPAVGPKPLLSAQGVASATLALDAAGASDAFVTVNCQGPGRYTVTGDGAVLISSVCTGSAAADIRLPLADVGRSIHVEAPERFWLVIAPVA